MVDVIVVLNGASSAGKTTLAKALQEVMRPQVFVIQGIDTMTFSLPRYFLGAPWATDVFRYIRDEAGEITAITAGPLATRLVRGLHAAVAAMAATGLDVIVDHVLLDPAWKPDLDGATTGSPVFTVGVHCPLDVLIAREHARKDRTVGQAAAQFPVVHQGVAYDLELDTSTLSPEEGADLIARHLQRRTERRP